MSTTTYNFHTIILKPGEEFTLPPGGSITSASDVVNLESTCDNLPSTSDATNCYFMQWELEGPNSGSDAWENGTINSLFAIDTTYTVDANAYLENDGGANILRNAMLGTGLFTNISIPARAAVGDRVLWCVCFKTLDSIASSMYLKITSSDNTIGYFPARAVTGGSPCACAA